MRAVTVATFREDPLFPKTSRAVEILLEKDKVVRPIDALIGMQLLSRDDLEEWCCGRVPYLETVIDCNLTRLSRLLRILRFHLHDLSLVPSTTAYTVVREEFPSHWEDSWIGRKSPIQFARF